MALEHGNPKSLLPPTSCTRLVQCWLEEDCPSFDTAGFVVGDEVREAKLLGKSPVCFCLFANEEALSFVLHYKAPHSRGGNLQCILFGCLLS